MGERRGAQQIIPAHRQELRPDAVISASAFRRLNQLSRRAYFFSQRTGSSGRCAPKRERLQPRLTDAAGTPIAALPGPPTFDSAMSFGSFRRPSRRPRSSADFRSMSMEARNWMIRADGSGHGGAMDLVHAPGASWSHAATPIRQIKIVRQCTLPMTATRSATRRH